MSDKTNNPPLPGDSGRSDEQASTGLPVFDESLVALWTLYELSLPGTANAVTWDVTNQRLRSIPTKVCTPTSVLEVAGVGVTNLEGMISFPLSYFYCPPSLSDRRGLQLQEPIILTASVSGGRPVYMTTEAVLGHGDDNDVTLTFFSWGIAGRPVPSAVFRWHLTIAATVNIG